MHRKTFRPKKRFSRGLLERESGVTEGYLDDLRPCSGVHLKPDDTRFVHHPPSFTASEP